MYHDRAPSTGDKDPMPTTPRLRWIALITDELERDAARVQQTLGLACCLDEPHLEEFGIASRVYPLGPDRFLELLTPVADGAPQRHLQRRGPGLYMVTFQVDDLAPHVERLHRNDIRVIAHMARDFAAGRWESVQLHPGDVGASLLSLDRCTPPEEFPALEADWRPFTRRHVVDDLAAVQITGPDPDALTRRWSAALGLAATDGELPLADTTVHVQQAPGPERVTHVLLRAARPAARGAQMSVGPTVLQVV
jgi:hypothetical protein